jgi:hypothetical protein
LSDAFIARAGLATRFASLTLECKPPLVEWLHIEFQSMKDATYCMSLPGLKLSEAAIARRNFHLHASPLALSSAPQDGNWFVDTPGGF